MNICARIWLCEFDWKQELLPFNSMLGFAEGQDVASLEAGMEAITLWNQWVSCGKLYRIDAGP